MYLLSARNLKKSFGARTLFSAAQLRICENDRIGLVGQNGAGKSTLLGLLSGEIPCDEGEIERRCGIAVVRQSGAGREEPDAQRASELLKSGTACKSGGERTRRAIAAAFSQNLPLLFADEPTTNLDAGGIAALQRQLLNFRGAVVLVSHDRALLDAFCTSIWAIEGGEIRVFPGGYSAWLAQRGRERAAEQAAYEQYCAEKKRLTEQARALREQARGMGKLPSRMGNSEARLHKGGKTIPQGKVCGRAATLLRRAERLEPKARPDAMPKVHMALGAASPIVSPNAVRVEGAVVRYGTHTVLQNVSFTLKTGSRTVMLGENGAGKSSLAGLIASGAPAVRLAQGVRLGYFSQNHELLDPARSVLENVREESPLPEHEVRTILANLGLAGDAVHQPAGILSGGERAKAALARLLASDCNLLVLDEPTNHIDLYTLQALEALLESWQGTMLLITHDRRLAERLAQRLLFVENGGVSTFEGDWAAWQAALARRAAPRDAGLNELIEQMRRAALQPGKS